VRGGSTRGTRRTLGLTHPCRRGSGPKSARNGLSLSETLGHVQVSPKVVRRAAATASHRSIPIPERTANASGVGNTPTSPDRVCRPLLSAPTTGSSARGGTLAPDTRGEWREEGRTARIRLDRAGSAQGPPHGVDAAHRRRPGPRGDRGCRAPGPAAPVPHPYPQNPAAN
jgi:hypothetical protein